MTLFAVATVPLIQAIQTTSMMQAWFANDAASGGSLLRLRCWWDSLVRLGLKYGYFPHPVKHIF